MFHRLYTSSPVWVQNVGISAFGYHWYRRRFGGIFHEQLKQFRCREAFTTMQWRDYQTTELRRLLCHAFETVPLYRTRFGKAGFQRNDLQKFEIEDLPKLPVLTKNDLRSFGKTSLLSIKREKGGQFFSSSGSTGTPVNILYSNAFHQRIAAAMEARVRNWAGVNFKMPRGMVGGRKIMAACDTHPPFYRYNYFEKQTYFSAYHISLANIQNYIKGMIDNGVCYMTGYAYSNYLIAVLASEAGLTVPSMKAVITSSEKLTGVMKATMQQVYNCNVFDSYSGVENCGLISQHPSGDLLINPDVGIMETIPTAGDSGEEYELICTGLLNFDQPLIRYQIGDCVTKEAGIRNRSGNAFPVVSSISGRVEDIITTADGRKMVRFHSIFVDLKGVIEGQIIQHDHHHYTVKVVSNAQFDDANRKLIIQRLKSQLGDIAVNIEEVPGIERTSAGKLKAVISELSK